MKQITILLFIFLTMNITSHSQELKSVKGMYQRTAFIKGKIYTVDDNQPYAESVVVEGNKIIYVGSEKGALDYITAQTKLVDLEGKLMLPGFNDAHLHMMNGGFYTIGVDLRPAKSLIEFSKILENYVKKYPGRWVTQGRWDNEKWNDNALPTKDNIDEFSKETPILVKRIDGHIALANSYALKLAGITKDTPDPAGGLIERDPETGEPNGLLKDLAIDLVDPLVSEPTEEDYIEAGLAALNEFRKYGITSIQDITYNYTGDDNRPLSDLETYQQLEKQNKLTCRIYSIIPFEYYKEFKEIKAQYNFSDSKIKLGSLKAYVDGALGSRTAWFFEPYIDDSTNYGIPYDIITDGSLKEWVLDADKKNLQLCVHAIGDRANDYLLDLYKQIKDENPEWERRFRIEHAQHLQPDDMKRFSDIGVIASVQPYHCIDDGTWAENRIGPERIKFTHPYKSFLDNNVVMVFGTDWPVAPINPLLGIYGAVTRRTVDDINPDGWIPEQKISVEEAIKCYTLSAAYASFEEDIKGSIEVGKLADFVVLSDDILTIDPVKIKDVEVDMTVFDGEIIYQREK
ncbi:MAG: amidohydrolase [Ignavibacterium sp.]|nr:MAG: amidohydrolase [Ignavibacterium sp.]